MGMIKKVVKRLLRSVGLDIVKHDNKTALEKLFTIFNKINFQPKYIIDVGANRGLWTRRALQYFPDANYTLLEPQVWLKESVADLLEKNKKIKYYSVGAGEKEGKFKFTITEHDVSSSFIYSEEEAVKLGLKQIDVPVITLNNLVNGNEIPDIIKVDAEGLDIEVLKGASNFLGKTEVIFMEAGVVSKQFKNDMLETLNFMDKNGYRLFELTDFNRPPNGDVLWLLELAFVKKNGIIDSYPFEYK